MSMLVDEATEESLGRAENLHELVSAIKDFELSLRRERAEREFTKRLKANLNLRKMAGDDRIYTRGLFRSRRPCKRYGFI